MEMLEVMHLIVAMMVKGNRAWLYVDRIPIFRFLQLFDEFLLGFFHPFELGFSQVHRRHIMVAEEYLIIHVWAVKEILLYHTLYP
jgi:hypothetical protein